MDSYVYYYKLLWGEKLDDEGNLSLRCGLKHCNTMVAMIRPM